MIHEENSASVSAEEQTRGRKPPRMQRVREAWRITGRWITSLAAQTPDAHAPTPAERKSVRAVIITILCITAIFFGLVWYFWKSDWLRFWLQTLTGNWSPEPSADIGGFLFSFSVLLGIMLNWLPLLAAALFFSKFIKPLMDTLTAQKKEIAMNMNQAISTKTGTEQLLVITALAGNPDAVSKAKLAFEKAATQWKADLVNNIGLRRAQQVFDILEQKLDGPE